MEPAADLALADHQPGRYRLVESLEVLATEIAVVEKAAGQVPRLLGYDNLARAGQRFEPSGQIGRVSDRRERLSSVRKVADDDEPRGNSDTHLEFGRGDRGPHGLRNVERGPDRSLRVVFVRTRIAEISEDAVPDQARHDAVVPLDDFGAVLAVRLNHLRKLFRIEAKRQSVSTPRCRRTSR